MVKLNDDFTVTPAGSFTSLMCSEPAIFSAVTSASIFSGIAPGSDHTSRSRRICERMPPLVTPSALPTRMSGIFTFTCSFSRTSMKSTWSSSLLTGFNWKSFTSTVSCLPSTLRPSTVFMCLGVLMAALVSLASTEIARGFSRYGP